MRVSETAVFFGAQQPIELQTLPIPALQPSEILIRNEYMTLCRSDIHTYAGKRVEKTPTILGHEIVGRIAAFAPNERVVDLRNKQLEIGDRVSWAIFASDPTSEFSQRGIPQKGPGLFKYGHEQLTEDSVLHGGLSQFTILKPHTPILKIDESIPVKVAAIINCAVATVAGALRLAGDLSGKNVLISGAGMLGMIACAMSKTMGAAKVVALDVDTNRLQESEKFGADIGMLASEAIKKNIESYFSKPNTIDLVIELSGAIGAMEQTLELLRIGGTAIWVGAVFPQQDVRINAEKIVRNLLTIKGLHNYNTDDFLTAVHFMEQHHQNFPFESMIYEHFSLHQVNEAFEYALHNNPFRVGIKID